jgi:hypothetical protein
MWSLADAERHEQLAASCLVEGLEIERAVALITQQLDESRPALLERRLNLTVRHAEQMHLQRLD